MATSVLSARSHRASMPWYIWASVAAVTSAMVGVHWDISWHRSIGRDAFLTPAHIAIYMCGVLAAVACGYLILATTFGKSGLRDSAVSVWGFRAPLGAFISTWGGLVMLASAPFDDWWHSAYGLDVKILSPPHMVLALGMIAVEFGALILVVGAMNRATADFRPALERIFLYLASMLLIALLVISLEYTGRIWMHTAVFYCVVCLLVPLVMALASRGSGNRWAATQVALLYTTFILGLLYILPLFAAEPKLGPVYTPVKQFIPPGFPLLVVVPALALDLVWQRLRGWNAWAVAGLSGALFLALLLAVQWPMGTFLMSHAAHNAVFGSIYIDYQAGPKSFMFRNLFIPAEPNFRALLVLALALAILSMRAGWAVGNWIRAVRR
ncbi:MAG TPA: hypothetical protein DEQ47_04170 [Solibacterales bacterium]|nr:hypothetical protein [Bryobacterales bacterium]